MKLESPYMRYDLIASLYTLKNREGQMQSWVDPNYLHAFWDTLRFDLDTFDTLFDPIVQGEEPISYQEGSALYNAEESEVVMKVAWALENVCEKIGHKQPDAAYYTSPLWDEVLVSSQQAYDVLVANNEKYGFFDDDPESQKTYKKLIADEFFDKLFPKPQAKSSPNTLLKEEE